MGRSAVGKKLGQAGILQGVFNVLRDMVHVWGRLNLPRHGCGCKQNSSTSLMRSVSPFPKQLVPGRPGRQIGGCATKFFRPIQRLNWPGSRTEQRGGARLGRRSGAGRSAGNGVGWQTERLTRSVRRVAGRYGPVARATHACKRALMPLERPGRCSPGNFEARRERAEINAPA